MHSTMLHGAFQYPDHVPHWYGSIPRDHDPRMVHPCWSTVGVSLFHLSLYLCMLLELPHGIHRRLCSLRCATGVVLCAFPLSWLYHTTNISGVMILGSSSGCGAWYLDPSSSPDHWISWIHVFGCCGVIVFIYAACTALSTHCSVCVLAVVLHIAYHSTAVLRCIASGSSLRGLPHTLASWISPCGSGSRSSHGSHDPRSRGSGGLETLEWTILEGSGDPSSVDPSLSSIAAGPLEYPLLLPFAGTRGNPRSII